MFNQVKLVIRNELASLIDIHVCANNRNHNLSNNNWKITLTKEHMPGANSQPLRTLFGLGVLDTHSKSWLFSE